LSDLNTRMPSGSDVTQRTDKQPAFSAELLGLILRPANILAAWKRVRANKGAAGIDGMSIDDFPAWAKDGNWKRIMSELCLGQYQPSPVRRVEIDKPDCGKRQLGIPTIVERVIQQAIAQVLTPIFDPTFSDNSFGFRPNRNGQQAVKQVQSIFLGFTFNRGCIQWHPKTLLKFNDIRTVRRSGACTSCGCVWHYQQRAMA